jgi:hypothetical protein
MNKRLETDEYHETVREAFESLERTYPKRSRRGGRYPLLRNAATPATSDGSTLYLYVHSSQDTYAIHETIFRYRSGRTARQWDEFFFTHVFNGWDADGDAKQRDGLLRGVILPAMNLRSNKLWDVISCIGYSMYALPRAAAGGSHQRRHKTKSPRVAR